jgi:nucleoid-associated protein EbfC
MDLNKLMQQAAQMQEEMQQAQAELADQTVEASAGGGMVTVKVSGALEVKEIRIAPEAIDPEDPELLADTVLAAVNEGIRSAQSMVESRMSGMLGGLKGMGLPGL